MLKLGNTDINKSYLGDTEIKKAYLGSNIVFESENYQVDLNSNEDDFISIDLEQSLQDGKSFEITTKLPEDFTPKYITGDTTNNIGLYVNTNRTCIINLDDEFNVFSFTYDFEFGQFCKFIVSRVGNTYSLKINNQEAVSTWDYTGANTFDIKTIGKRGSAFVSMDIDSFKINDNSYNLNEGSGYSFNGITLNTSSTNPNYFNEIVWQDNTNKPIKIYTFLGQSNQDGRSPVSDTPKYLTYSNGVKWIGWNKGFSVLQAGVDSPNLLYFQSSLKFSFDKKEQGQDFRILQVSQGGTSLHTDWADGGSQRNRYNTARARCEAAICNVKYDAIFWMQGEADSTQEIYANDYYTNLTEFVTFCKSQTNNALFIDAQIRESSTGVPFASIVNTAKVQVFNDGLSDDTFSTENYTMESDNLHYDINGLIQLSNDFRSKLPNEVFNTYEDEYNSVLSRALQENYVLPSDSIKTKQNELVSNFKSDGVYSRLDTFAMFTDTNDEFSLIDWVNTDNLYDKVDNISYFINGWNQESTLPYGYINTNYKPSNGVNKTENSSSYFTSVSQVSTSTGNRAIFGLELNNSWLQFKVVSSEPVRTIHEKTASNTVSSPNNGQANVNYLSNSLNGTVSIFEDGVSVASSSFTNQPLQNYDLYLFGIHRGGVLQQQIGAFNRTKYFGAGSSLSDLSTNLNDALNLYYQN